MRRPVYARVVFRDLRESLGQEVRNFFRVSPENTVRIRASLGTACAALCAVLLADWMNLGNPWWAGITTLVVSRATYGATLAKGVLRVVGTVSGAALSLPLVGLCVDNVFAMFCLIFFVSTITVIMTLSRGRDSYAWSMAGFIIVLIALDALNTTPDMVFPFAVYRSMEITLGTVVGVTMSALFNRAETAEVAARGLEDIWKDLAEALRLVVRSWESSGWDEARVLELRQRIEKISAALPGRIFESRVEGEWKPEQVAGASRFVRLATHFARRVFWIMEERPALRTGFAARFVRELEEVARCVDLLAGAVRSVVRAPGDPAVVRSAAKVFQGAVDSLNAHHAELVRENGHAGRSTEEMLAWAEFRHVLGDFSTALAHFADWSEESGGGPNKRPIRENMVVRQAMGLGLTMVLIPIVWNWCDFPGMLQMGVTSIVLLQPDPVVSRRKGILRLTGCLTGGGLGLLLLGTWIPQYFVTWFLAYFIGVFLFSWLDRGDSRCSYIGLQAGIALTVTLVQGFGQGTELDPPLTRFCGILGAFTIWNIVNALMGGLDSLADLRRNVHEFFGFMGRLLERPDEGERAGLVAESRLRLKTARRDLDVMIWEGERSVDQHVFLQELLANADRVLMEGARATRMPKTPEAREVLFDARLELERMRDEVIRILESVRGNMVEVLPDLRQTLENAPECFDRDAAKARSWAHDARPPEEALLEIGDVLMSLRGMFEALAWMAENEPRIRDVFFEEPMAVPEAGEDGAGSISSNG